MFKFGVVRWAFWFFVGVVFGVGAGVTVGAGRGRMHRVAISELMLIFLLCSQRLLHKKYFCV